MNPVPTRRSRRWMLATALFVLIGLGFAWRWWVGSGPQVGGRSLSRWLTRSERQWMDLVDAVPGLGAEAVPVLIQLLEWRPNSFERLVNDHASRGTDWLPQDFVGPFRTGSAEDVRAMAGFGLALLGPKAAGNADQYEAIIERSGTNVSPTLGLAILGSDPDSPRTRQLLHRLLTNAVTAPSILPILRRGPLLPPELLPDLLGIVTNRQAGMLEALELLPPFGTNAAAAAPAIMQELERGLPTSRTAAGMHRLRYVPLLELLASLGPDAILPYRDKLLAWTADGRVPMPHSVIRVLGPRARPWEQMLLRDFDAPQSLRPAPLDRMLTAASLAAIAGQPTNAIPELLRAMRNRALVDPTADFGPLHRRFQLSPLGPLTLTHRDGAVWLLGEIGPGAAAALPALRAIRGEDASWTPVLAAWAIWRINSDATEALPVFAEALGALDPYQRYLAMAACEELGPAAAPIRQAMDRARDVDARLGLVFPRPR